MNEIEFSLPIGFIDRFGICHKSGRMRLAKVADEIMYLNDERVLNNKCYLGILLLSQVITQLGTVTDVNVKMIEQKDCTSLQNELSFTKDQSNTRELMTGENNDKLIRFLKFKMKECGCKVE